MPTPKFRSPVARAVMPVLGGVVVLAALAGLTWAMAAWVSSGGAEGTSRIAPSTWTVGPVESLAESVAEDGPLLFTGLGTSIGERSIVVDHTGEVAADGWRVYWAYPADRDASCVVQQVTGTRSFTDCEGRTLDVSELAPPDRGVVPIVEDRRTLVIDLRGVTTATTTAP